uniref:Uncharacterized protein n=1 Tax=Arundo donax TaxID=35708 RepID=A0A0A9HT86_ARUDO
MVLGLCSHFMSFLELLGLIITCLNIQHLFLAYCLAICMCC